MLRDTLRVCITCLVGALLCISSLQVQFDGNPTEFDTVRQRGQLKGAPTSALIVHRRWSLPFQSVKVYISKISVSSSPAVRRSLKLQTPNHEPMLSPMSSEPPLSGDTSEKSSPVASTPMLVTALSAPWPASSVNPPAVPSTSTPTYMHRPVSSLPLPVIPPPASPSISPDLMPPPPPPVQAEPHASVPSPAYGTPIVAQPPFPANKTPTALPPPSTLYHSPRSGLAPSMSTPGQGKDAPTTPTSPSTPYPAPSPLSSPSLGAPSDDNTPTMDSPMTSPSSGCCASNMVPRPGLPSDSCTCVYPIRLQLVFDDVSPNSANWSGVFQQELASQLNLNVIQIEINSFNFNGTNLSMVIVIGPLTSVSFSLQQADTIKTALENSQVHFNSSLFGNYTLLRFRYFEPPTPPPSAQTPAPGLSPWPALQMLPQEAPINNGSGSKLTLRLVIGIAAGTVLLVSLLLISVWKCLLPPCKAGNKNYRYRAKGVSSRATPRPFDAGSYDGPLPRPITTRLFTFEELRQATNNFEHASVLGEGGFGRVYKGVLKDGTAVAIKRLTGGGNQGDREFLVEVEMLSRLHHRNLVKLIGYYTSRDSLQHLLCYELIPNGSLEAWLHGPLGANQPLDWDTRMKIALDAARGLAYLHEDSQPCVIHRDFKASNILIENNFHAKVADFGLAKQAPEGQSNYVSTRVMGTFGYVAPEYAMTGHLLVKSDVYSYGVVLLELLSGRKPVDMSQPSGQENLVTWARPILRDKERLGELADPRLFGKYPREDFVQVAAIAAACVAPEAGQRPTMGEVVQSLKLVQRSSENPLSGEREALTDTVMLTSMSNRSIATSWQNARQTSTTFESDGSSSVFSSGPFSGLCGLDNDTLSRTAVFSEDLHEGR